MYGYLAHYEMVSIFNCRFIVVKLPVYEVNFLPIFVGRNVKFCHLQTCFAMRAALSAFLKGEFWYALHDKFKRQAWIWSHLDVCLTSVIL